MDHAIVGSRHEKKPAIKPGKEKAREQGRNNGL